MNQLQTLNTAGKQLSLSNISEWLPQVAKLAEHLSKAIGFVPDHYINKPGAIAAAILRGHELGIPPLTMLASSHSVKGKIGLSYDAILGLLIRAGYKIKWTKVTKEEAEAIFTDKDGETYSCSFTIQEARDAGLVREDSTWKKYPKIMLQARVLTLSKPFTGGALSGVYTIDQLDEIEETTPEIISVNPGSSTAEDIINIIKAKDEAKERKEARNKALTEAIEAEVIDSEQEEPAGSDYFNELSHSIGTCENLEELKKIRAESKSSKLTKKERAALTEQYNHKVADLEAAQSEW